MAFTHTMTYEEPLPEATTADPEAGVAWVTTHLYVADDEPAGDEPELALAS